MNGQREHRGKTDRETEGIKHTLIDKAVKCPRSANIASVPDEVETDKSQQIKDQLTIWHVHCFDAIYIFLQLNLPVVQSRIPPSDIQPSFPVSAKNFIT